MSGAAHSARPIVTANQVTLARLLLLPIGAYLLYQGVPGQWAALVSMTIVGCTDFVDGWLARRYGVTVLGSLMDPIADKVFVALTMLPALDLGWIPTPVVLLIFLREFVITAFRTSYSRRDVQLRSTYLAKVKTWYQMILAGIIFLLNVGQPVADSPPPTAYMVVAIGCTVGGVLGGIVFFAIKRRVWRGSIAMVLSFGPVLIASLFLMRSHMAQILGWMTVVITWASAGVYLSGVPDLLSRKPSIDRDDIVRLVGAVTMPIFTVLLIAAGDDVVPAWPVFSAVALEFSIGGLDNLLAHQKRLPMMTGNLVRIGLQTVLLGTAVFAMYSDTGREHVPLLCYAALAVTTVSAIAAFVRHRAAYLGADVEAAAA